jgi:NADH-quinone oxidoreductase subunit A
MQNFSLSAFLPVLLMFVVAVGFAASQVLVSQLFGQRRRTPTKQMPYECGKDPVGSARERFSVKFYLIAMIFVLFDIELIFLTPWAVVFKSFRESGHGLFIWAEMMTFVVLLLVGYIYVWKKGLFDWSQRARVEAEAEAKMYAEKRAQIKAQRRAERRAA